MSYRGINYGKLDIVSDSLRLNSLHNGGPIFQLAMSSIHNSTMNKQDIIVETGNDQVGNEDCLCEIRLHIEESKEQGMDVEDEEGQHVENLSYAQQMYQKIVSKAKIGEFAGESMATLLDVNLAVPRGKYTIDFHPKSLRFHGMTFNYHIDYRNITKGFILPMANEAQVWIVLQLNKDKPIYQGQTVYRYIVVQVKKDVEVQIRTKLNPEAIEKEPRLKELKAEYSGPLFQVFVDLLQTTSGITLVQPGNSFKSKAGQPCLKCNVKAQPGWLYLLKQSLIFILKPVLYFKIEDILEVQFTRLGATNKQFDMKVTLREDKKSVEFMGIQRPELELLIEFMKTREVKIRMEKEVNPILPDQDDDESEDEDFEAEDSPSDDDASESSASELGSQEESASKDKGKGKNHKRDKGHSKGEKKKSKKNKKDRKGDSRDSKGDGKGDSKKGNDTKKQE